jgi:cobalt-zinc-cadmium efflux system protein
MQKTPKGYDVNEIKSAIERIENIDNIHHIHLWNLNDREVHFEAHIDLNEDFRISECDEIRNRTEQMLRKEFKINHVTLQMEYNCCNDKGLIAGSSTNQTNSKHE